MRIEGDYIVFKGKDEINTHLKKSMPGDQYLYGNADRTWKDCGIGDYYGEATLSIRRLITNCTPQMQEAVGISCLSMHFI